MSCILSIIGENLDIDDFIIKSQLQQPFRKTYKGHPRFKTKPEGEKMPYSLLSINVSDGGFDDFKKQEKDALKYLEENYKQLKHIATTPEIQYVHLDFGIENDPTKFCQEKFFSSPLLKLAGDLGIAICISIYQESGDE